MDKDNLSIPREKMAMTLAIIEAGIQPLFPVTDDIDSMYQALIEAVPKEDRQAVTIAYMGLQNAQFVKLAHTLRQELGLDVTDKLLKPNSEEAAQMLMDRIAEEANKQIELSQESSDSLDELGGE